MSIFWPEVGDKNFLKFLFFSYQGGVPKFILEIIVLGALKFSLEIIVWGALKFSLEIIVGVSLS